MLVPIIDVIDSKDFQYSTNGYKSFQVGGFEWSGHFDWIELSDREKKRQLRECDQPREICPAYSPTMAGGLFAIDRRYFWDSGSYDEQVSVITPQICLNLLCGRHLFFCKILKFVFFSRL